MNIDEDIAYRIGWSVAQNFSANSVVIGFDARETKPSVYTGHRAWRGGCGRRCLGQWHGGYRGNWLSSPNHTGGGAA